MLFGWGATRFTLCQLVHTTALPVSWALPFGTERNTIIIRYVATCLSPHACLDAESESPRMRKRARYRMGMPTNRLAEVLGEKSPLVAASRASTLEASGGLACASSSFIDWGGSPHLPIDPPRRSVRNRRPWLVCRRGACEKRSHSGRRESSSPRLMHAHAHGGTTLIHTS